MAVGQRIGYGQGLRPGEWREQVLRPVPEQPAGPGEARGGLRAVHPPTAPTGLGFRVLGPLTAEHAGRPLHLGPLKQRLVLAVLLCRAGTPVTVDTLVEAVWQGEPPCSARKNLQVYVSALRKLLDSPQVPGRLVHHPAGYVLQVDPAELDLLRFRALVRDGRAAAARGEAAGAARLLREGLDLWRGVPLPELHTSGPVRREAARLEVERVAAYEDWAEAELRVGNARVVADDIGPTGRRHPLRERLQAARMSALHQAGRRAEALAAYEEVRQRLARELGLSASPQLEGLYQSILADGPAVVGLLEDPARSTCLLPPDLADFTGRAEDLRRLDEALRPEWSRAVVLVGPAGAGKTALAVHGAYRRGDRFPDGRLLVGLRTEDGRPRPPAAVFDEIVRTAGLATRVPDDPARAAALCRAWLAERRVLLILDDAPDEVAARMLLPGGGPGRVLVTSRSQLVGLAGVHRVDLPPYTAAEALDLLARIIGADRPAKDPVSAGRIVVAAGMLPLAVRVCGMRLAVLRHLPLAEYAARLANGGAVLGELAAGDVAVRPRLAVSWRDLSEPDRATLLLLAGLPVGVPFTLTQAVSALRCGPREAQRDLERLIEAGAVSSPQEETPAFVARYTLPCLLHLYVREQQVRAEPVTPAGTG